MSTLVNISKQFGKNLVLDNISLDLTTHGITALVGPSGCGKSTLLRIAAGLLASDSGEVNTSLTRYGVVFQEPRLLPWLKVCENLALAFPIRDKSKKQKIEQVLHKVYLEGAQDKYPRQLSGGMAQRVAIARALLCEPKILLMDEPFASLDAITRSELQQMLLRLIEEQQLHCLFVTHDLAEAELISERLVVMQQGTIAASFLKKEDSYPPHMVAQVRNYLHLR